MAKELGMSVARCMREVSYREFLEWSAYYTVEPFGEMMANQRAAVMPFTFATAFAGKGRKPQFQDFVLGHRKKPVRQTAAQQEKIFEAFVNAHNQALKAKEKQRGWCRR